MFTAALFIIAELWNHHRCPKVDEWIKKMCYIIHVVFSHKDGWNFGYHVQQYNTNSKDKYYMFSFICGIQISEKEMKVKRKLFGENRTSTWEGDKKG
jgi:hypothetical protein